MAWTDEARNNAKTGDALNKRNASLSRYHQDKKQKLMQEYSKYGIRYYINHEVFKRLSDKDRYLYGELDDDGKLLKKINNKLGPNSHGIKCELSIHDIIIMMKSAGIKSSDWSRGNYDIARYLDSGPYSISNSRFITHKDNMSELSSNKSARLADDPEYIITKSYDYLGGFNITSLYLYNNYDDEWKSKVSKSKSGKSHKGFSYKCVTDGKCNKKLPPNYVEEFLVNNPGFRLGMTRKRRFEVN